MASLPTGMPSSFKGGDAMSSAGPALGGDSRNMFGDFSVNTGSSRTIFWIAAAGIGYLVWKKFLKAKK